ncbi:MAG: hypothetical protein AYL30_007350 [Candidatus Hecatellales archaeon B24]|nr:MAG: hypothetical protein AYL30_007350 [Candidatus Hecatellales archaeon B24]
MSARIFWDKGITLEFKGESLHLDVQRKPKGAFLLVSHAHGDHTGGLKTKGEGRVYLTRPTLALFKAAAGKEPPMEVKQVRYGERFKAGVFRVEAFNSGHIFGSSGFLVEAGGLAIAYTGDLNFVDSLLTEAAEPVDCDILILEATYGSPSYRFPSRNAVYSRIVKWTVEEAGKGRIPVFHVYPVGKAQEIVCLLNQYTSLQVYVHPKIARINRAHRRFRVKLEAEILEGKPEPGRAVLVYPKGFLGRFEAGRVSPAIATGWAVRYQWTGLEAFPLSSHADFPQLLSYVKASRPKKVYTCYGFSEALASAIRRKLGINAEPLPSRGEFKEL